MQPRPVADSDVILPRIAVLTDGAYAWRRLCYNALIGILCNAATWATIALLPAIQSDFNLTRAQAAYPYIALMLGFLVGSPLFGRLSDRFGIARVLVLAALAISLGYGAGIFAPTLPLFLCAQFLVGIGTAVGYAPLAADITHWFTRRRGFALSLCTGLASLSGLFWAYATAPVLRHGTWREAHGVIALAVLAVIPLSLLLRRRVPDSILDRADAEQASNVQASSLDTRSVKWVLGLAGVCCCIAMATPSVHIVALCSDLGFSLVQGNDMLLTMIMGGVISRLVFGLIIDRIGALPVLMLCSTLQMMSLLFYIPSNGLVSLHIVTFAFGLAQGGILPAYPLIVRCYLPAREAGGVIGFVSMGTIFGMAFGGLLSGWIYDLSGSYLIAFLNGIAWNLMNLLLIGLLFWRATQCRALPPAMQES